MKLDTLLKKRQRLEAEIAQAQRRDKRRAEILALIEGADCLDISNEAIAEALRTAKARALAGGAQ